LNKQNLPLLFIDKSEEAAPHSEDLSDFVELAALVCEVPVAFITLNNSTSKKVIAYTGANICDIQTALSATNRKSNFHSNFENQNRSFSICARVCLSLANGLTGSLYTAGFHHLTINPNQQKALELIAKQVSIKLENTLKFQKDKQPITENSLLFESFYHNTQHYQILLNTALEIVTFNRCAAHFTHKFTGLNLKNGCSIHKYISPLFADEFNNLCNEALKGEKTKYKHFINRENSGKLWFGFTISPIYNSDKETIGLTITGSNINRQKRQEKTIKHQSDSLSIIAQLQSHQVRHPVTSILGLMSLIKEDNYNPQKEYLINLEQATQQLDQVIKTIVSQSRQT